MRELESSLQEFGEFLPRAHLVRQTAAPYFVRWVRRFLLRPASDEPLADQVRVFGEELEREGRWQDWQPIHERGHGRRGAYESVGGARAATLAAENSPLLLPHRVHLIGCGDSWTTQPASREFPIRGLSRRRCATTWPIWRCASTCLPAPRTMRAAPSSFSAERCWGLISRICRLPCLRSEANAYRWC
jgi:hypothetical protein